MNKKIIINALGIDFAKGSTGIRRFSTEIIKSIQDLEPNSIVWHNNFKHLHFLNRIIKKESGVGNYLRFLLLQTIAIKNFDTVFFSPVCEGLLYCRCKQIVTVADILPIRFPELYPRQKYYFKTVVPLILRNCEHILTISNFTKAEILSVYPGLDQKKISVIYPGYNKEIFRSCINENDNLERFNIHGKFILTVCETRAYKNMIGLINALNYIKDVNLVIVGRLRGNINEIKRVITENGLNERIIFTGYVSDTELVSFYKNASVFIFPSKYEGFGIPVVEAMACGCPVTASNVASIPEVGGDAIVYFDPEKPKEIAEKANLILNNRNLANSLIRKGSRQCQNFSYTSAANKILNIVREL